MFVGIKKKEEKKGCHLIYVAIPSNDMTALVQLVISA